MIYSFIKREGTTTEILEKAFKIASNFSDQEQEILANHWIRKMRTPNFIERIKEEMKWEQSFSESHDILEMLADEALEEIQL